MRFSEFFNVGCGQSQLDFVDVPLGTDMRVFIDPHALATTKTPWCIAAHQLTSNFFQTVLNKLRGGDRDGALSLLLRLREDNRTRSGYSAGDPGGSGFGDEKAYLFLEAIEASNAFQTGRIGDIEDTTLFMDRVGFDIVSDMMTNVIRQKLAEYTQNQCALFGIPTRPEAIVAWHPTDGWINSVAMLPHDETRAVLLLPRSIVRKDLSLQPTEFIREVYDAYDRHDENAISSLERLLQTVPEKSNGKIHRSNSDEGLNNLGSTKHIAAELANDCPELLARYKEQSRRGRVLLTPEQLDNINPDDLDRAYEVAEEVRNAQQNANNAMDFARAMITATIAAFHPLLQDPKRIEINVPGVSGAVFANTGMSGLLGASRVRVVGHESRNVIVLGITGTLTVQLLQQIDSHRHMGESDSGLVLIFAQNVDRSLLRQRRALSVRGIAIASAAELANIAEQEFDPQIAFESLEQLIAA